MGQPLMARLQAHAGLTFAVEPEPEPTSDPAAAA
jgi:hypothetical protein